MESETLSSGNVKRASHASSTSSSEMGVSDVSRGKINPSFQHEEETEPVNQTYYADELISIPELDKVKQFLNLYSNGRK